MKIWGLLLFILISCQEKFQVKSEEPSVTSARISSGRIILHGTNLHFSQKVIPTSANLTGFNMEIETKTSTSLTIKLVHASSTTLNLALGTVLSFLVSNANAGTTVTLTVDVAPAGAVMSFNLPACPAGWSDYTPAEGRFIAGIDPTDLAQNVGDVSAGDLPTVTSTLDLFTNTAGETGTPGVAGGKLGTHGAGPSAATIYVTSEAPSITTQLTGSMKPPHVILKYCEKD